MTNFFFVRASVMRVATMKPTTQQGMCVVHECVSVFERVRSSMRPRHGLKSVWM